MADLVGAEEACSARGEVSSLPLGAFTPAAELKASYDTWVTENKETLASTAAYGKALKGHGCLSVRHGQTRVWTGIALND